MQLVKWIATGILVLPLAELVAFLLVAGFTGFTVAFILVVLISLAGVLVLRQVGGTAVTTLRAAGPTMIRSVSLDGPGTAAAVGGILMVIPGFITGILGLLVAMPQTRKWLASTLQRRFASQQRKAPPGIIDLTPDEWRSLPEPDAPPHRPQ